MGAVNDRPRSVEKARQEQRLRVALRENLKRRKRQARGRAENRDEAGEPHDSAGIAAEKENG